MNIAPIKKFFEYDGSSGILLMIAALLALIVNNSMLVGLYDEVLHAHLKIKIGGVGLDKSISHWINDGLMTIFFLTVGLEIKRELMIGSLQGVKAALLPLIAALGGVIFPALIYAAFNHNHPDTAHGWGIPMATDIAFAVGVLSLLGRHVPKELKILLLSLAVIDDLIAILVIAVFYTSDISLPALGLGAMAFGVLMLFNLNNVKSLKPYILVGTVLWLCILESGIHATIAGVLLAFAVPLSIDKEGASPLKRLEHSLYPWAAFVIMPIFAFANAGFSLEGIGWHTLGGVLPLGIILGLFFGKQLGVFSFIWVFSKLGVISKPAKSSWKQIYGLALLTGIGFTVSLFIGSLAFSDADYVAQVRLSVLLASAISAIFGYLVLRYGQHYWGQQADRNLNPIAHPEVLSEENEASASSRAAE